LVFVLFFYLVNILPIPQADDIYSQYVFMTPMSYFALLLIALGMGIIDSGLQLFSRLTDYFLSLKEQERAKLEKERLQKDKAIQRRRVTNIECKSLINNE
jgi:hypothetical protein